MLTPYLGVIIKGNACCLTEKSYFEAFVASTKNPTLESVQASAPRRACLDALQSCPPAAQRGHCCSEATATSLCQEEARADWAGSASVGAVVVSFHRTSWKRC